LAWGLACADHPEQLKQSQPAFRFTNKGLLLECLVKGLPSSSGVFVLPTMRFGAYIWTNVDASQTDGGSVMDDEGAPATPKTGQGNITDDPVEIINGTTRHHVAWLPGPGLLNDVKLYAVRCVSLYSRQVGQDALNATARWAHHSAGAPFEGKRLAPYRSDSNPACANLAELVDKVEINDLAIVQLVQSLSAGACPGTLVEGMDNVGFGHSGKVFKAPPALIRIRSAKPVSMTSLPHCTAAHSSWGRWLPVSRAKHFVVNGGAIPRERTKYWVPYFCKGTFWDHAALSKVSQGHFKGSLECNLDAFQRVLFTGDSTASGLFASMREFVLGEKHERARRDKAMDHVHQEKGQELSSTVLQIPGFNLSFSLRGHLLPDNGGKSRKSMQFDRRAQIEKFVTELGPTAIVMNIGVHELCGAFGSNWFVPKGRRKHVPCSSRAELLEAYSDFGAALAEFGYTDRVLFRSIFGTLPDIPDRNWRWEGFARSTSRARAINNKMLRMRRKSEPIKNPCPAVAGPSSHAAWVENDASRAWAQQRVRFVDVWAPVHSSPTVDAAMSTDGLHIEAASDEALAVNQLIIGALCALPRTAS
jgi:hypothetical protein